MSPPAATYMRPGAGLYYIKVAGTSALARHRYHIHLVRSLLDEAHQGTLIPLQYMEVLHLYRWYTHTHTPHRSGADGMKLKVRWQWKWNEHYLTRTRRGERKRRGTERTPTRHTWPRTGKPWKGKGKEKRRPTDNGTRPAEGGEGRKRLNQPHTARTYAYLSTRRTQPTWRGENARTHEIRDPWGTS